MFRNDIIAQIEAEMRRLEQARDFLVGTSLKTKTIPSVQAKKAAPAKKQQPQKKQQPRVGIVAARVLEEARETVAPVAPPQEKAIPEAPQIQRVPPKRRLERRPSPRVARSERAAKPVAALSGAVPAGPVVVSANEARKVQERIATAPANPEPVELASPASSERSLGSLIQAFERSNRSNGLGTP